MTLSLTHEPIVGPQSVVTAFRRDVSGKRLIDDGMAQWADGWQGTRTDMSDGSPGSAEVRDIVAKKADIGSGRTYYNLHKVMLAADFEGCVGSWPYVTNSFPRKGQMLHKVVKVHTPFEERVRCSLMYCLLEVC